jgi:hypothetical protein
MAAGLGFKDFVTGEVLTAADVDGYLMQNIWVFANAAARDAAVTSPQEGNACYLKDTDAIMTYSGSAWVTASAATSYGYAAGKNAIINGAFNVWQRGTSFTNPANSFAYTADRWSCGSNAALTSSTVTQQTFAPGTAPVAGYESSYFYRSTLTTIGSSTLVDHYYKVEDVRTFAGQTATLSFWAKADSARTFSVNTDQVFGSGGSASVGSANVNFNLTTAWQRFTLTLTVPSISGKTIGTNNYFGVTFHQVVANGSVLDLWGVQLEAGSTATAFQTATGTIQGELAACQRYYFRTSTGNVYGNYSSGLAYSTTNGYSPVRLPVTMRVIPTSVDYSTLALFDGVTFSTVTSLTLSSNQNTTDTALLIPVVASGLTQYRPYFLVNNNSTSGYVGLSAEL